MSADLIVYIGLAILAVGLVALALWHVARRSPLIYFGTDALYLRIAERVLREMPEQVEFNQCPRCGGLARTPRARQCRHCYFDWHDSTEST